MYIDVILPLAVPRTYSYSVPRECVEAVQLGVRVEVQFGRNRLYAAIVLRVRDSAPDYATKDIVSVLDTTPIIGEPQLKLWQWVADYYCCYLGEVMNAALPSGLRLGSETRILVSETYKNILDEPATLAALELSDNEYMVVEALAIQGELGIDEITAIVQQKSIQNLIQSLLKKEIIVLKEELQYKYKPKTAPFVQLCTPYSENIGLLVQFLDSLPKIAVVRQRIVLAMIQLHRQNPEFSQKSLCELADCAPAALQGLEKKGIIQITQKVVSRTASYTNDLAPTTPLSTDQIRAIAEIKTAFTAKNTVLLHGVTGSGKTRVYTELIQETIAAGKQVLYLLPEIALTAQLTFRLQKHFGNDIMVYHSRLSGNERVELWREVRNGKPIVLAARSGLFLPYRDLGLIIIDEEHDPSYKQTEPAPRYNARDAAIYLSHIFGAKTLLGTATPSLETYFNVLHKKYGYVRLTQRFGGSQMPEIQLENLQLAHRKKEMKGSFSEVLLQELRTTIADKGQAILFQNRRGYAPSMQCNTCGYAVPCVHCDVSLTYHQYSHSLRCHYCGYQTKPPVSCVACGSATLHPKGFGTEKIEEELQILLPEARIARMDLDTVRGKFALSRLIEQFEEGEIDVLVGTQMVTKGLDFDNVRVVGILSADQLLHYPDFRASERAFQLITQVAGRAGRKLQKGKVVLQALNTDSAVLHEIMTDDATAHYTRELTERHQHHYPPYVRLINIELKHKERNVVAAAADFYAARLRAPLGKQLLGPTEPSIARVRNYFLMQIMIKIDPKIQNLAVIKQLITAAVTALQQQKGFSSVRVNIDVDPY